MLHDSKTTQGPAAASDYEAVSQQRKRDGAALCGDA